MVILNASYIKVLPRQGISNSMSITLATPKETKQQLKFGFLESRFSVISRRGEVSDLLGRLLLGQPHYCRLPARPRHPRLSRERPRGPPW